MLALVLDHSLRILVAAAAVGLVLAVFRVRSGAARHAAWSAVLLAMLTLPVLTAIVPGVEVPVPSTLAIDPGTIADRYALLEIDDRTGVENAPDRTARVDDPASAPQASLARASTASSTPLNWTAVALVIYSTVTLLLAVRLIVGWLLSRKLVARSAHVPLDVRAHIAESAAIAAPLTTGIVSPTILLPIGWREWPADTLRAVLAHEQAHVDRRDCLVSLLAQVNRAIFWFHPLGWWLERTLSTNAEHACDERVIRQTGEPHRYAEVLLRMAEAVSATGSRIAWPAIGVDGSGVLGARIDRVLRGDLFARMSPMRRIGVAASCGAVLLLAVACRQQVAAMPLRPNPEVEESLAASRARSEKVQAAVAMSAADVAALEASLERNPQDLAAHEKLLTYYRMSDAVRWEDQLAGIRKHAMWMIENAPEGGIWIPIISKKHDPQGYEAARRLWLEQVAEPDVSIRVLASGADFLSAYDKPVAEALLLRARSRDPESTAIRAGVEPGIAAPSWPQRLGLLYARAITGNVDRTTGSADPVEAASPFASEARQKLDATTDAQILRTAGAYLLRGGNSPDHRELGRTYLQRVVERDPQDIQAKASLASAAANDRSAAIGERLSAAGARDRFDEFSDTTYEAISHLPVADRLFYLPRAAESAYMRAESVEYTARDKADGEKAEANRKARAGWARSRQYAEDALRLAEANTRLPESGEATYRANVVLAVLALKDGDRHRSIEYMERAANAPSSEALLYSRNPGLRGRLVEYLLREGERESVAAFLEKAAASIAADRERLLNDAAQIRDGVMPMAYQYAEARR